MGIEELKIDIEAALDERVTKLETAVLCLPEILKELCTIRGLLQESAARELRSSERADEPWPKPPKVYQTLDGPVPAEG